MSQADHEAEQHRRAEAPPPEPPDYHHDDDQPVATCDGACWHYRNHMDCPIDPWTDDTEMRRSA